MSCNSPIWILQYKDKDNCVGPPNKRCLCRSYPPELCKLLGTVIRYCGLPKNFSNLLAKFKKKL